MTMMTTYGVIGWEMKMLQFNFLAMQSKPVLRYHNRLSFPQKQVHLLPQRPQGVLTDTAGLEVRVPWQQRDGSEWERVEQGLQEGSVKGVCFGAGRQMGEGGSEEMSCTCRGQDG